MFEHKHWITDLTNYKPNENNCFFGQSQAGFSVSLEGKILLSDNFYYTSISELLSCFGTNTMGYVGLYCWKNKIPQIYVFKPLKKVIANENIKVALNSLVGVHFIKKGTPVICNSTGETLFNLLG